MEDLHQLTKRSRREIEVHTPAVVLESANPYFLENASVLLACLRLWLQDHDRPDQAVREILSTHDVAALQDAVRELRDRGNPEAQEASQLIAGIVGMPERDRQWIVSHACLVFR